MKPTWSEVFSTDNVPIKAWVHGVPVEEAAIQQLRNCASLPFVYRHLAAMPDIHWGMGVTVGSVIATRGAIIPAAVGVDIGCGMIAVRTNLRAEDLPDNLLAVRSAIEAAVPHGRTDDGGPNDRGAWGEPPEQVSTTWDNPATAAWTLAARFVDLCAKHPKLERANHVRHLGTLGSGNHFIQVCLDEAGAVWAMLHSGSPGGGGPN